MQIIENVSAVLYDGARGTSSQRCSGEWGVLHFRHLKTVPSPRTRPTNGFRKTARIRQADMFTGSVSSYSEMAEQWQMMKDAQAVEDCILDPVERKSFHAAFNSVGWDVDKMRAVICLACNNIPQSDRPPGISFHAYTL